MANELNTYLGRWCERRRTEAPEPREDGKRFMVFDGEFEVSFFELGERLYFASDLGPLPQKRAEAEALLDTLMKQQMIRARTSPDALAIDREGGTLVLQRELRVARLEYPEFERALNGFVNSAAFWTRAIDNAVEVSAAPPAPALQIMYP